VFIVAQATGPVYKVAFRRRRKNLTNYAKRLALVKGGVPRLVVRKSSKSILVQALTFDAKGDKVLAQAHSRDMKKYGFPARCNSPTAYLCGLLAGRLALKAGAKEFNLDIGMYTPSRGALVFAAARGAIDAGLKSNYTEEMIAEARVNGTTIAEYAKSLKGSDEAKYSRLFSSYLKENFQPEKLAETFAVAKAKIGAV